MPQPLLFLPAPRQITLSDAAFDLKETGVICVEAPSLQENLQAARQLQETVNAIPGIHWEIAGGAAVVDVIGDLPMTHGELNGLPIFARRLRHSYQEIV